MATNTTATSQNHNGTGSQNNFAISFSFLENKEYRIVVLNLQANNTQVILNTYLLILNLLILKVLLGTK